MSQVLTPTGDIPPSASDAALTNVNTIDDLDLPDEDAEQLRLSRRIQQSLEPCTKTFIFVSATLRFPPPHRMAELDLELTEAKRAWEDEVIRREEKALSRHVQEIEVAPAVPSPPAASKLRKIIGPN